MKENRDNPWIILLDSLESASKLLVWVGEKFQKPVGEEAQYNIKVNQTKPKKEESLSEVIPPLPKTITLIKKRIYTYADEHFILLMILIYLPTAIIYFAFSKLGSFLLFTGIALCCAIMDIYYIDIECIGHSSIPWRLFGWIMAACALTVPFFTPILFLDWIVGIVMSAFLFFVKVVA